MKFVSDFKLSQSKVKVRCLFSYTVTSKVKLNEWDIHLLGAQHESKLGIQVDTSQHSHPHHTKNISTHIGVACLLRSIVAAVSATSPATSAMSLF